MTTVFPFLRIHEWNIGENSSPVGVRNVPAGSPAFKQIISVDCETSDPLNLSSTSGTLLFEDTKFEVFGASQSHLESRVAAITVHVVTDTVAIGNLKLYLQNDSAFQASQDEGLDRAFIQFTTSGIWQPGALLPSGAGVKLETFIPNNPNVFRQDGALALVNTNDFNSSQFIYMNLVSPLGTPLGTYGICGSGLVTFCLGFDYWCNDFILEFGDPSL
jgi:hypothetical protein